MNITKISTPSFRGYLIRGDLPPSDALTIKIEDVDELINDLKKIKGEDNNG